MNIKQAAAEIESFLSDVDVSALPAPARKGYLRACESWRLVVEHLERATVYQSCEACGQLFALRPADATSRVIGLKTSGWCSACRRAARST